MSLGACRILDLCSDTAYNKPRGQMLEIVVVESSGSHDS